MNLCLNAFVIQFPDGLLDTCSVTAPPALLLPYAHRGHCKDEDSYKECWSHVEFSIGLTRTRSATAGGAELCFHFILHNFSFILAAQRRAVGSSEWLGLLIVVSEATFFLCSANNASFPRVVAEVKRWAQT